MSIAGILNRKGGDIVRLSPDTLIRIVVQTLSERRIGAVLIMQGDSLLGILSERDVIGALSRHDLATLDRPASALMTKVLWTITPDATLGDAMRSMTEHRVRHLPVLVERQLVGLVSIGDIVNALLDEQASEVESLRAYVTGMH